MTEPTTSDPIAPRAAPRRSRTWWPWVIAIVGVAVIGGVLFVRGRRSSQQSAAAASASAAAAANRPVPVVVATVERRDLPLRLEGLGSVAAFYTVTVKTQVEGRIDKVFFTEGQTVKKGDVLAQIDPRPFTIALHQANAALARDAAILKNAKINLERYETLFAGGVGSQQQVTDQKAEVAKDEALVAGDQATVENARLQLDFARIVSPIDGVTGVRLVDPGNVVHVSDPTGLVVVTQIDPIAIVFSLPEDDLPRVTAAMAKEPLVVSVFARDGENQLGEGKLALIDNQINSATATIKLKAILPNTERKLWPNQFVKARLTLGVEKNALVVPATVVQRGPQGTFAYVVAKDQTVSVRPIELAFTQGDVAVIAKGVEAGERVVADGQSQLRPGAKIAAKAADSMSGTTGK